MNQPRQKSITLRVGVVYEPCYSTSFTTLQLGYPHFFWELKTSTMLESLPPVIFGVRHPVLRPSITLILVSSTLMSKEDIHWACRSFKEKTLNMLLNSFKAVIKASKFAIKRCFIKKTLFLIAFYSPPLSRWDIPIIDIIKEPSCSLLKKTDIRILF